MKVFVPSNVMVLSLHTLYWRQPDLVPRTTDEVWYLVTVQLLIASILDTAMLKCILVSKYNTHFLLTILIHTTTLSVKLAALWLVPHCTERCNKLL